MKQEISKEHIDFYRENGFVIIKDFLNPDELAHWREAVDEAVKKRNGNKLPDRAKVYGEGDDEDADYYDNVFDQLLNLWMDNEKMRKIMLDERLGQMAAA
ncbi:MAG: phytanoyl-CoA dioxygenase family protein, partial [Ferruginibacter sp.]